MTKDKTMKVGVIGIGAMGAGMAVNFHKAGHLFRIWNRTPEKARAVADQTGVTVAASPEALAAECELVITCVSRDADVLEMMERMAPSLAEGKVVVDTSTTSSDTAREAAAILSRHDARFFDAPVSGGVEGARNGTLAMMVGGDGRELERLRPVLQAIAKNIVHIGPVGSGQACKAVNQIMCAGINQAVTEALAFGEAMQLDMDRVIDVVATGAAGNWFLQHRGKTMLAGTYNPGFKVSLHHKDLKICADMAAAPLPLCDMTLSHYQRLMEAGHGDEDISALYRLKRPVK